MRSVQKARIKLGIPFKAGRRNNLLGRLVELNPEHIFPGNRRAGCLERGLKECDRSGATAGRGPRFGEFLGDVLRTDCALANIVRDWTSRSPRHPNPDEVAPFWVQNPLETRSIAGRETPPSFRIAKKSLKNRIHDLLRVHGDRNRNAERIADLAMLLDEHLQDDAVDLIVDAVIGERAHLLAL